MSHIAADLGLHGYKNWLQSLQPYPEGTIVKFVQPYVGVTKSTSIAAGQELMIVRIDPRPNRHPVYKMVIHRNGKLFRKTMFFGVEAIARRVIDKECEIV